MKQRADGQPSSGAVAEGGTASAASVWAAVSDLAFPLRMPEKNGGEVDDAVSYASSPKLPLQLDRAWWNTPKLPYR